MASAQPAAQLTPTESITYTGTITAIDPAKRIITTRGQSEPWQAKGVDDFIATWEVPANVPQAQIDSLKVGQVITVIYSDAIEIRRKPAGEAEVDTVDRATGIRTTTATVTAVDVAARTVTFTGPTGRTHPRRVVNQASVLRTIAVGDRVDVRWLETMQIVIGPVDDWMTRRRSVAVLLGPDNQFAGNLIKQATGQTLGGVPINLKETTYDDVYGRMGLFKVGLAYRMSRRAEGVFNFVISRGSAETASLGTVGAANLPVSANFDDYNYWGFEGGQRFLFPRARVTPFAGYLVGVNRHGHIRAEFVNVPANLLPGYAAQDKKIFERSWAFSFGPIGGVIIPLGPIELIG